MPPFSDVAEILQSILKTDISREIGVVFVSMAKDIYSQLPDASPLTKIGAGLGGIIGGATSFLDRTGGLLAASASFIAGSISGGLLGSGVNGLASK